MCASFYGARGALFYLFMILLVTESCVHNASNATLTPSALPNIVLIFSDDHAWTDYGFMGHPMVSTPNIDRLASEGVVFPR